MGDSRNRDLDDAMWLLAAVEAIGFALGGIALAGVI